VSPPNRRVPVVVGAGQVTNRPDDLAGVVDAVELMERALVAAADDAGTHRLLDRLDRLAVMQGRWRWPDPARLVAERVGAKQARTVFAMASGSIAQDLVADACRRIQTGEADVVAICGGEWAHGRRRLRAAGLPLPVTPQRDVEPDERFGANRKWESPLEIERGFTEPLVVYALFESAIAAARGEGPAETQARVASLAEHINDVAVTNDHAWRRDRLTAADLVASAGGNRPVAFPYTKWMVANPDVDMAFALVVCAAGVVADLGVPTDRCVFPMAAAGCDDPCWFSELDRFDRAVNHELTIRATLAAAGVGVDDIAHLDLYSCFPSAVTLQAQALGIDPLSRSISVTGGMPFFGGPLASYVGHAIVESVHLLRRDPDQLALCVGNGGYLNKLATGLYAGSPPSAPFGWRDVSQAAAAQPHRKVATDEAPDVEIEATTVVYDRTGPRRALVTALTPGGERAIGGSDDGDVVAAVLAGSLAGRPARIGPDATVDLAG
jgi:acetyl-CoA C-acetyltransferase